MWYSPFPWGVCLNPRIFETHQIRANFQLLITLFELGCFGNRLTPSFSLVVQSPNLKCSLAQNLSKALNFDDVITIACDVMKQFLVLLEEDFRNFICCLTSVKFGAWVNWKRHLL